MTSSMFLRWTGLLVSAVSVVIVWFDVCLCLLELFFRLTDCLPCPVLRMNSLFSVNALLLCYLGKHYDH